MSNAFTTLDPRKEWQNVAGEAHLPSNNSPTIDAGDPTLPTDQRGPGFLRVVNNRVDIGAVEVQATPTPTPIPTSTPRPTPPHPTPRPH